MRIQIMHFFQSLFYLSILTLFSYLTNVNAVNDKNQDAKCLLPMEPGPCRMSLNRFYYNAKKDACEEFKFGGCMGNDNKFGFKQTCEEACKKSVSPGTAGTKTIETLKPKQLNPNTLKTLTSVAEEGTSTTSKPTTSRTTVKSKTTTSTATKSTTTTSNQKSKPQI